MLIGMRLQRWLVIGGVAGMVVLTALEGCSDSSSSSGDLCKAAAACTGAPVPTLDQEQQCFALLTDAKCGTAFKAMKECQTFRAQCTASGTVNTSGTNTLCRPESTAYSDCQRGVTDAGTTDGCRPRTCSQLNANCGEVDNGCGTKIMCGSCTNGQTCGGGGSANRCGCACDPTWCGTLVACGTTVTCPTNCAAPQFCGGAGIANRCGCSPTGNTGSLTATSVSSSTISLDGGTQATWNSTTSARVSDNSYASALMNPNTTTQYLVALSYGAALPATAIVDGITVTIERSSSAGIATSDYAVQLVKGTTIQIAGDNKASAVTWPSVETTVTYGGPTDKWGSTWTPADINAGGFGVALSARYTSNLTTNEQARVDSIKVTVHYSGITCN
jgi:hypothetical protein